MIRLLPALLAGQQRDDRIEQRGHGLPFRRQGSPQQQGGIDAGGILAGLDRILRWTQGKVQTLPPVLCPIADVLDPSEEAGRDLRAVVHRRDQRVEFGAGEVRERGLGLMMFDATLTNASIPVSESLTHRREESSPHRAARAYVIS